MLINATVNPLVMSQITEAVIDGICNDAVLGTDTGNEHGHPSQHAKSLSEYLAW